MRSVMVVLMLVAFKFQIERVDIQGSAVKRKKLVAAGAIGALDAAVQLGRFGWQHIQRDAELGYYQKCSHICMRQTMASDLAGASPISVNLL